VLAKVSGGQREEGLRQYKGELTSIRIPAQRVTNQIKVTINDRLAPERHLSSSSVDIARRFIESGRLDTVSNLPLAIRPQADNRSV
jgi:hypothetical protein